MSLPKPLEGIKVVELSNYLAAPICARVLGDWGADVIKVEPPAGDIWRKYGVNLSTPIAPDENPLFDIPNANKRSIVLDLKDPGCMEAFHKLLAQADVFVTNNRPTPLKKMGLDYETLKERYPRLIYALLSGYGDKGPDREKPGFDTVAFWASGGFMADMRVDSPGSYPIYTPAGVADVLCGTLLFGGISAALLAREKTGRGDKIVTSLFGTAVWGMGIMNTITQEKYQYPYPKKRYESKPTAVSYACADGEWMMISVLEYARYFRGLCTLLGVPELADDPRYLEEKTMMLPENKAALIKIFEERFVQKTSAEWDELLTQADIVHDRLVHFKEITGSEQARANHFVEEVTFGNGTKAWLPRPSVQSENLGLPEYRLSPALGADTREILAELGYSEGEISKLTTQS
ncbi:Cinnamoyl-CoA:phenyllactate CoA-transferase [bioreactor metagenome]|uniref:Cinnamoyl-CoA:phenyllactate CoA-transferase n=1 Tax=bioreactor metagenome TaxID=1076179 RepID=A0A645C5U1_9ZZZZ